MDWTTINNILVPLGSTIALLTLIKGVLEYAKNNAMKRAEYFSQLHRQLKEVVVLSRICDLLDTDSAELAGLSYSEKYQFLAFFESVALMVNSRLLREDVAQYMFSYYAILCYESRNFWSDISKESQYWSLFCSFARRMKALESRYANKRSHYEKLTF